MKIAVIGLRGFPSIQGGVESHCENLLTAFGSAADFIVYRRRPYLTPEAREARYPGITFVDLPSTRIKGFEALFHTLLASLHIIVKRPAPMVNIHNIGPGLLTPLLRIFGFKVVLTYHSPNYEHRKWGPIGRSVLRLGEWMSLRFASRVIFVNRFQMEKYTPRIRRKSVFIPNGITLPTTPPPSDFLERHGLRRREFILAVGRLTPEKDFETLLKAIRLMPEPVPLVIAGAADHDTAYADRLHALADGLPVVFTGFTGRDDLNRLYSSARLFVLSSVNEGFPLVLLEAMTHSLPLVVTDIPATRLIDLPADAYTPAGDPAAMAAAITTAVSRPFAPIGYDLTPYDWSAIARRTSDVYTSLYKM